MKKTIICCLALLCLTIGTKAQTISSPDGKIQVSLDLQNGKPCYSVNYEGQAMLNRSALGVVTNIGDYTQGLTLKEGFGSMPVSETYTLNNIKQRQVSYQANEGVATYLQNGLPVHHCRCGGYLALVQYVKGLFCHSDECFMVNNKAELLPPKPEMSFIKAVPWIGLLAMQTLRGCAVPGSSVPKLLITICFCKAMEERITSITPAAPKV